MNESAGQLDQSFVKKAFGPTPLSQPKLLQDLVGLEKQLLVETYKISQVMGVPVPTLEGLNQGSYFMAFMAHGLEPGASGVGTVRCAVRAAFSGAIFSVIRMPSSIYSDR